MFPSLCVFLNFFQNRSIVFMVEFLTSLVRFIPRYLMLLGAIVNEIDSSVSISSVSLLVYRNAIDFVSCNATKLLYEF